MTEDSKSEVAKREEEILKFWREEKIFEKSLEQTAGKKEFVFYDGPPFATGLPHFGHLLPTSLKDAIPRYQTMRGFHVDRRWGWDCHGLPIENLIERELGLKTKKDIEALGIETFNQKARESVLRYADEWQKIIPRVGRWVDMDHAYKTMDPSYTENVWSVFKTLHDKSLVYEGYKSMHLCPHCETTLANFEVSQGYKDVTDLAVTVKFELVDHAAESFFQVLGNNPQTMKKTSSGSVFLLAWTTTPWTLPGNVALAVNPETNYVRIKANDANGEVFYILGKERLEVVMKDQRYEIVEEFLGEKLVGKKYKPLFDYYQGENGWQVYRADFVTTEDGTGIVHIAPGFGEADLALGQKYNLPFIQHVGVDGKFKAEVTDFAGLSVKPKDDPQSTDILIIKYLAKTGTLFAKEKITHPYPHCWRCDTPLLNYAASSWFVAVTKIKTELIAANEKITWVPEHIKAGRFGKWLEGARDWAVSRSRFWGAPLPVWRCEECKKVEVIGSLEDLKSKTKSSGNHYWIMRHGEAENNARRIISNVVDAPHHLTELGKAEVLSDANKLKKAKLDLIVSSDFVRTKETTEILKQELGLSNEQVIFDTRLREANFGNLNGQSEQAYSEQYPSTRDKFTKPFVGGESYSDVKSRLTTALYDLEQKYQGKNILLISHESPLLVLTAGAQGFNLDQTIELYDANDEFIATGEVRELNFKPLPHNHNFELDFHRPFIDQIKLRCECGLEMTRVPDVFDVWFESGSMPYLPAQTGIQPHFPADFIAEGLDQTRGWFYVMLVLSVALKGESAYRRVVVNGLILAEDGQKMSKRLNNFPDLMPTINKYGADALRFYLLSSPAVRGEEFNFAEAGLREVGNRVLGRLRNVVAFYEMYAGGGSERFPRSFGTSLLEVGQSHRPASAPTANVLDQWITARLNQLISEVTGALDRYELDQALRPIDLFVDDLSTWYLRRSRERLKSDSTVLRQVLIELAKVLAPFTPFIAEEIYRGLKGEEESVHLEEWPHFTEASRGEHQLLGEMLEVRKIVSLGLEARAKAGIKVRQPLASLKIRNPKSEIRNNIELAKLIQEELNVKEIIVDEKLETEVELDTTLTPALREEGELRDLIREVQDWRKAQGLKPGELAAAPIPAGREPLAKKYASELLKVCHVTFTASH